VLLPAPIWQLRQCPGRLAWWPDRFLRETDTALARARISAPDRIAWSVKKCRQSWSRIRVASILRYSRRKTDR